MSKQQKNIEAANTVDVNAETLPQETATAQPETAQPETATAQFKTGQKKSRRIVFFRADVVSPTLIDYVFDFPQSVISGNDPKTKALITLDNLKPSEREVYEGLIKAFNIPALSNVGVTSFDENNSNVYCTYPTLSKWKGQNCLVIGADSGEQKAFTVALENRNGKYFFGEYELNFALLGTGENKSPFVLMRTDDFIYHFSIRYDYENVKPEELQEAFLDGEFEQYIVSPFKPMAQFNKFLHWSFQNKAFPVEGILFLLQNCKIGEPYNHNGTLIYSANADVVSVSPNAENLPVYPIVKKGETAELIPLEEIGKISFGSNTNVYKLIEAGNQNLVLHIIGPNRANPTYYPEHTATRHIERLSPAVKAKHSEFIAMAGKELNALKPVPAENDKPVF